MAFQRTYSALRKVELFETASMAARGTIGQRRGVGERWRTSIVGRN